MASLGYFFRDPREKLPLVMSTGGPRSNYEASYCSFCVLERVDLNGILGNLRGIILLIRGRY